MSKKSKQVRAGVVPYIIEDGNIKMMFMKSQSNPNIGWQLAKGGVKLDEDKKQGAFREASEELGLFKPNCNNIKNIGDFGGITLFIAEVLNLSQFGDPEQKEVLDTAWLTLDEFVDSGRMSQKHIVKQVHGLILDATQITKEDNTPEA